MRCAVFLFSHWLFFIESFGYTLNSASSRVLSLRGQLEADWHCLMGLVYLICRAVYIWRSSGGFIAWTVLLGEAWTFGPSSAWHTFFECIFADLSCSSNAGDATSCFFFRWKGRWRSASSEDRRRLLAGGRHLHYILRRGHRDNRKYRKSCLFAGLSSRTNESYRT